MSGPNAPTGNRFSLHKRVLQRLLQRQLLAAIWCAMPYTVAAQAAEIAVLGDGIAQPLAEPGDARRGRALLLSRDPANCVLCHGLNDPAVRFSGNLAPPLDGAGSRLTTAQLRLRVADSSRLNPDTIMPAYFKTEGLREVASSYRGKPVLTPQQVEDLVVYLSTLR